MVPTSGLTISAAWVHGKGQEQQPEPLPGSILRERNGILKESWRNAPWSRLSAEMGVASTADKLLLALVPQFVPQLRSKGAIQTTQE